MSEKKAEKQKGFVIVSKSKGVFLGGGRWSSETNRVKNAPVYADSGDQEALKRASVMGRGKRCLDDLSFEPVEHGRVGFASREEVGRHWASGEESVAGEMGGEPAPETKVKAHDRSPKGRKK